MGTADCIPNLLFFPCRSIAWSRTSQWLGHAGFRLQGVGKTIYIDPYRAPPGPTADYVLITHDHFDHFSPEDLKRVADERTQIIAPATVTEQMRGLSHTVAPGDSLELDGLYVTVVAAYNTNKLNSEGKPFHPARRDGSVTSSPSEVTGSTTPEIRT